MSIEQDFLQALDSRRYIYKDLCRITMKLRYLELGYNNGRAISMNKQQILRDDETVFNEDRMRKARPSYRLMYATPFHLCQLADRIKASLKSIGVCYSELRGISREIQIGLVDILDEIYMCYKQTLMMQEEQYQYFEKNVKNYLNEYKGNDLIVIKLTQQQEDLHQLFGLLYEMDSQMELIMGAPLRQEDDANQQVFSYGTFNEYIKDYQHLSYEPFSINLKLDIIDNNALLNSQKQQQSEQIEIVQDRNQINYIKEFYDKFKSKLIKQSPEYWNLLIFDIIRDLSNKTLDNNTLELKFFDLLKSVQAAQYLLLYRKEIISYLNQKQFWNAPQSKSKTNLTTTTSNHELLATIGIDVEQESNLGLRKQEFQGNEKQQKKPTTIQEGLVEFDPEEYAKMDQKTLLRYFPTSTKTDKAEYSYVRIDPLPKKKIPNDSLVKIKDLPNWAQRAFEGTESLNVIQTQIYPKAFKTQDNLLVCAPTGAGKTNIALLTILEEIGKHLDAKNTIQDHDFKIVYISPMKALASEIVDKFSTKLRYLGIKVKEFTGDMQLSKKELQETHVILTTPEKWDVITRKTNQVSEQLKLLIIDEVHLLNDERGPILECVVARTLMQVQKAQRHIRLVGLSATLPNYWDVAIFLECHKDNVFFFDQTFRPVPLCQKFIGVKEAITGAVKGARRRNKRDIQNEQTYEILKEVVKHNKQVLVFVHSRKETIKYAQWIYERAIKQQDNFLVALTKVNTTKLNDNELKKLFPVGLACHHAGMMRSDRNSVERHFLNGEIRVLVATATLAWGVNLPAYAVIIKGTDIFDISRADMQNLSVLDVQQMFGRAGRPQFDDQGEATLITDFKNMGHYMGMLNNASYIESKLLIFLKEALNAEIVLGNITNYQEAYHWINYTFLSVRLRRNPLHYGVNKEYNDLDLNCDILVEQKIGQALHDLDQLKLVRYDTRNQLVTSTELGRIASHYYIKCETMKILCDEMGISFDSQNNNNNTKYAYKTIYQLLKIVAKAKEFEAIRLRPEELKEIQAVYSNNWVFSDHPTITFDKDDDEEIIIQNEEKVVALISGYIANVKYENYALVMDTHIVIQNTIRLCRCMLDMAMKKNQAQMAVLLLKMCKLIENKMSEKQNPVFQFSKEIFQGYNSRKIFKGSNEGFIPTTWLQCIGEIDRTPTQLLEEDDTILGRYLYSGPSQARNFKSYLEMLPYLEMDYNIKPISQTILQMVVSLKPRWRFHTRWHLKNEPFWIIVDDDNEILHSEEFLISQDNIEKSIPMQISFFVPFNSKINQYHLSVTSDRWIMREDIYEPIELKNIQMEEDQVDFTELLDLQPLPITALANLSFESLYKYKYFNPIQTQVFFSLYHTDDNVLIGAPTGSGKTLLAEFAMLRIFAKSPDQKVVYIAPLKAIAKERLKDWVSRLKPLHKNVLELTGDFTPDLAALQSAHVLITTPEKWDGISRTWNHRTYVKQTGLIIFDEIHLLGQDRGPVLEVIVSRMNAISSDKKVRMIGLSTAMANGNDVSNWFGVKKNRFYNFKPSCRPVPVTIHFNGFPERAYCPRMATMNKPCYQDIKRYSEGKPTIVFVSSRRQTRLTAMDLIAMATQEGNEKQYIMCTDEVLIGYVSQIEDDQLKQCLAYGIGMHHSGLHRNDRQIVEDMFVNGRIQLLIATSTVAWGVNFPARLVIVKGTEFYDPKLKKYVDFPVTDLLQMIGRAGRPQFDTQATACVYVEQSKKNFYRKYLNSPFPIESSLLSQVSDHVNAEVQSGVITNSAQFIDWITWTYLFRRLVKNPTYYNCKNADKETLAEFLKELVATTIGQLQDSGCISVEAGVYSSTFLGKLSSLYYLKHQTMKRYQTQLKENTNIEVLLKVLAYSSEFDDVPVRHNEDNLNEQLGRICPYKPDFKLMNSPNEKTFILLQSHLFSLPVPIKDFVTDTKLVLDSCMRMIHCMIDLCAEKGDLRTLLNCILLMQMIVQGQWHDKQDIIKNIPHCQNIKMPAIKTVNDLLENEKILIDQLKQQLSQAHFEESLRAIKSIPVINASAQMKDKKCVVQISDNYFTSSKVQVQNLQKSKDASWWIIVGLNDRVVALKKAIYSRHVSKELELNWDNDMKVYIKSDSYLGIDVEMKIKNQ